MVPQLHDKRNGLQARRSYKVINVTHPRDDIVFFVDTGLLSYLEFLPILVRENLISDSAEIFLPEFFPLATGVHRAVPGVIVVGACVPESTVAHACAPLVFGPRVSSSSR